MNGLTLGNETFAAAYVVLALVLLFIEIARTDSKKWKIWLGVLAGIQLLNPLLFNFKFWLGQVNPIADPLALVGSAKASSIVAWGIVGYLIIHWVIGKIKDTQTKKFVSWGHNGIWITGIVVGLVLLFVPGSFVQKKYVEISSGARIIVWESAEKAIAERSVLGFGPETYPIATQKYFDNRLHLQENIGEIWFDRAHNYFIDNLIAVGFVGLAVIIALFAFAIITVRKAFKDGKISRDEYVLWVIFVVAYVVQLQTSFETIATYVLWAVFVGYVLSLANDSEMVTQKHNPKKASSSNDDRVVIAQMVGAAVLLVVVIVGSSQLLFKESKRQHALVDIFRTKTDAFAQRQKLITTALSRTESFESIRVSSASFIKGMLEVMARGDMDPAFAKNALTELQLYENAYVKYLAEAPDDYRAQVNLAYVYFIKTFLGGENSIEKGRELVVSARELSPASPISYGMEALSYLYEGKIKQARELAQQAVAINPDIEFTHLIVEHIEKNAKTFPEISFLKLENL